MSSLEIWTDVYKIINNGSRLFTSATIPLHFLVLTVLAKNFVRNGPLNMEYYKLVFVLEFVDVLNAICNMANHIIRETQLYEDVPWWLNFNVVSQFEKCGELIALRYNSVELLK